MSWTMQTSGSLGDVQAYVNAAQPPGGSNPQAVQHFANHRTLVQEELKQVEMDMKNDPTGKQGVSVFANGHWDEKNRNASCSIGRVDLKQQHAEKVEATAKAKAKAKDE